jgi:transposase InsO family protein
MIEAELNYPIHDKEMLAIVSGFLYWRVELESTTDRIEVVSDHKALEYFMTTKALTARQARWAEVLSRYHFRIMYKPGATNRADALTRREQDINPQKEAMSTLQKQTMLQPEQLDPRILEELEQSTDLCDIEAPIPGPILDPAEGLQTLTDPSGDLQTESGPQEALDLIDELLQANRTTDSLRAWREKASSPGNDWVLEKGLLKYQSRLVVPEEQELCTRIIAEAYNQVSTAYPGKNKTCQLIGTRYYWPGLVSDVDRFVRNCDTCRRSAVPRDKTPGLLQPLPIPERPWLHISMDFHELPPDKSGYNMVFVVVDRFGKRTISIPCHKTIDAKETARLFIHYVYRFYGPPDTIVSDRGPQFVSAFWKEVTRILGIKLKLSTACHPQTDGQTEITNQYLDQRLRPFANYFQDNWSELLPIIDYAQATLPYDSTGYAPIQLEMGYLPCTSFDWTQPEAYRSVREKLSTEEARKFAKRMESV